MNYIIVGLLLSIGWHVAKVIFKMVEELLFARLHKADWYLVAAGEKHATIGEQPGDIKMVKNQIGFHYTQEEKS